MNRFSYRLTAIVALAAAAITTTACSSSDELAEPDLMSCELELACPAVCAHLYPGDCSTGGALFCTGTLWMEGEVGAVMFQSRPGPGGFESDRLVVLLGDGTALAQSRSRSCPDGGFACDLSEVPFEPEPQELCDVVSPYDDGTCDPGAEICEAFPALTNCVPVQEAQTCLDVETSLGAG